MVYLNINDFKLMTKIVTYLDRENIEYTFNKNDSIKFILTSTFDKKTIDLMKKYKTIFITYNIEELILKNKNMDRIYKYLNKCYKVVVSIEYIKKVLNDKINTNIVVIHKEIPLINCDRRSTKIFKDKYIVINDFNLDNLNLVSKLVKTYNYKYYYIGFNKLNKFNKKIYDDLPESVQKVKYIDYDMYVNIVKNSYMVIDMNDNIDIKYIQIPILLRKTFIVKDIPYYDKFLISNKDIYMYNGEKDLKMKLKKIQQKRLLDLTDDAFYKISRDDCKEIASKYSQIVK